ncbi:replication initiator [Streptomyces aurantiogriseus]|uniref:Uncharacterized protein n=1 Tax=Streptomyces aurantiogriseus TaxID=66870 RepID=A0A918FP82_9ACTN|nr:hypothetical protein GCM10010251_95250 [Streptomyces aurantiogriseus]
MRVIRVDASTATILLTEAPAPKARDRQTGEIAKDAVSGEALMTIGVVYIDEGESSLKLEHLRLRAWAHMLGFRGHFSTKSRRYSTTLGALRTARADWRRAQPATPVETEATETTLVPAHWVFAGTGLSAAETWLAASLQPAPGTEGEPTR